VRGLPGKGGGITGFCFVESIEDKKTTGGRHLQPAGKGVGLGPPNSTIGARLGGGHV